MLLTSLQMFVRATYSACPDGCQAGRVEVVIENEYDDVPRRAYELDGTWWIDCDTCEGAGHV